MNDNELEQNLKTRYQKLYGNPPAAEIIWRQIEPHLTAHEQKRSWWKQFFTIKKHTDRQFIAAPGRHFADRPVQRIGIVLIAVVVGLMAIAATGYVATGDRLFNTLFNMMGIQPIAQKFSDYHQSKSIDGYTITIQKVYADANRVIIGYTDKTPDGRHLEDKFAILSSKLITEQGAELQPTNGLSDVEGISSSLLNFDASNIQGTPKELHLHLTIPYGSRSQSTAFHAEGNLTFDFSVPFHSGNVVNINRSITARGKPVTEQITYMINGKKVQIPVMTLNGHTATLKRVVITSSETRAYITGFGSGASLDGNINLLFKITTNGRIYNALMVQTASDVWEVNFDYPSLVSKKGMWTLTIQQALPQMDIGPIWNFKFDVK
jgi:Domain of unknown function (DUF4179)